MRPRAVLFELLVAAGVAGLTSLSLVTAGTPGALVAPGYAMAAAVVFRRRWPLATMAVVSAVALLQVVAFPAVVDPLPYDVAVLVAMYSVVKYGRRMRDAYLAGATVAVGIVIMVIRHPQPSWLVQTLWYVGVAGGVWLLGHTLRNRRIYVATLEEKAATLEREREHLARIAVADERAAIARELHDVVAHSLSVMIVQADGGGYALDRDPEQARRALRTVAETGREALADMGRVVGLLRGSRPEADDPRAPVTLDRLDPLLGRARSAGVTVEVDVTGERPALSPAVEVSLYRIVQEALTNVLRHAGSGAHARLGLRYTPDAVSVSVVDDGGVPRAVARPAPGGGGHGLVGMRERVSVHGGALTTGPAGPGWAVDATIPVRAR